MHWTLVSPARLPDYSGKILKLGDYDEGEHYKQTDTDWPSLIHQSPAAAIHPPPLPRAETPSLGNCEICEETWVLCLLLTLVPQQFNIPSQSRVMMETNNLSSVSCSTRCNFIGNSKLHCKAMINFGTWMIRFDLFARMWFDAISLQF